MFKVILFFFLISGCADLRTKLDPRIDYQRDLRVEILLCSKGHCSSKIGQYKFNGFGVVRMSDNYLITVKSPGDIDLFTATTCHREWKVVKPKVKWLSSGYTFSFTPVKGIENVKACGLELATYEREKGRHAWALIEFQTPRETIVAHTKCNGRDTDNIGVSACQAKYGLLQSISFKEKVDYQTTKECDTFKTTDKMHFEYQIPKGDCTTYFSSWENEMSLHRLTTFGYDIVPVRGLDKYKGLEEEKTNNWSDWE